jgi:hypothetical protein
MNSRHPLLELTLVRFREFVREPEAIFWVFVFPILLAAGLGLAFRNRPAEVLKVAATGPALVRALRLEKRLDVRPLNPSLAVEALRQGKVALVVETAPSGVTYRFDDTNPDGRAARQLANDAIESAAGRSNPVPAVDRLMREPGSRYIDFLIPGLLGMNMMGSAGKNCSSGWWPRPCRAITICFRSSFRACSCWWWKWAWWPASACWCSAYRCAARWPVSGRCASRARWHSVRWAC